MTTRDEMEAALEAVLFVSSAPVPRKKLLELFDAEEAEAAAEALDAVLERYVGNDRGVMLEEVGGGVRLVTRPELHGWLRRFFEVTGATKLSMAAVETLAIIAYRQPVTGPEIQELRGVSPSGVLKTLLEKHLVRIAGRKEVVGKPFLYCTSREFLVHFGLKSLKDLPPLEDLEESLAAQLLEPPEEAPPEAGLEAGPEHDREEAILRQAAEAEEAEGSDDEPADDLGDEDDPVDDDPVADDPVDDDPAGDSQLSDVSSSEEEYEDQDSEPIPVPEGQAS